MALLVATLLPLKLFADTVANNVSTHYPEFPSAHIEANVDKALIAEGSSWHNPVVEKIL